MFRDEYVKAVVFVFIGGSGMKLAGRILIAISLFGATASHALVSPKDVNTFTLDHGLKVIVLEDDSIPNANMYTFWKVGSRNEAPGITGLSHFFEHMMFKGSEKYLLFSDGFGISTFGEIKPSPNIGLAKLSFQ